MEEEFITRSEKETQELGEKFAKKLKPGDTVLLYGDLGFGKTTFTKGVAKGLGIVARVISPTFTIVRQHQVKTQNSKLKTTSQNIKVLYHVDLYRIEEKDELEKLGLREVIKDTNSVKLFEWAEKLDMLPGHYWKVELEMADDGRKISIGYH